MGIGRLSFVATLFIMALCCFVLSGQGWGWFVGGVAFASVGFTAFKKLKEEDEYEYEETEETAQQNSSTGVGFVLH